MEKIKKIFAQLNNLKFFKNNDKYVTIIFIIGILIAVNFIAARLFLRGDLTAAGDYSISKVSKKTAANLEDVVIIKTYFSRNLPAKYLNLEREVGDMLDEYANYSGGKIKVKPVDPASLENAQNELAAKGIPALQFNVMRNDSFQVVQGFLGISIEYGGKSEVIPVISDTRNLEYEITSAIKKLAAKTLPTVGLVTSNNCNQVSDQSNSGEATIAGAYQKLTTLYTVKMIDLSKDQLAEDINTLLIVGPKEKFTEEELKKIDAFVMQGKSLIILADGVTVARNLGADENNLEWGELLSGYGLKLNNDLISDTSNGRASFSSNSGSYQMTYLINYPLWPKVLPNNMDQQNAMSANLQSLIFPWSSSIEVTLKDGENVAYLAKTTADARSQKNNFILDPKTSGGSGTAGQYALAVFVSGKLTSPYDQGGTDKARIVLVGDSDFVTDMFTGGGSDNMIFFQNLVDGLTLDNDLINIRAKSTTERPIKVPPKATKEVIRYVNIFGMAVIILAVGLVRYFLRRRNKVKKAEARPEEKPTNVI